MENKDHGKPEACIRIHTYAHAYFRPTYVKVLETMKDKFFCIKTKVKNEYHIIWEPFQTPIFSLYKAIHGSFSKHAEIPKGKHKIH